MKKRTGYTVDSIFVLVLFAVFAVTVLFVLMSGAGVYKDTQSVMTERYQERTALSYITAKVNHYDSKDKIYVTEIDGAQALAIDELMGGTDYTTYIYCYEGSIMEIMVEKGQEFELKDGLDIIEAKSLEFDVSENLIKITCVGENGTTAFATLHVESQLGGDEA
ncbi:MAG: DUF4860 domain-containing protein [Oscillospiraceae bacterium]|nr:DUF4860 domain-containing protein [Candidatus Limimonas coprohippi]